jgi:two-component system alkaline phosphatase synthesis response regulator PhoP
MGDRILVADGESDVCRAALRSLEAAGYDVLTFSTLAGIEEALNSRPSLMLVSAILPDGSGVGLCRRIRRNPMLASTLVIVLTAGRGEEQSCAALEAGADNCLAKPFSPRELLARVQAALRRGPRPLPVDTADIVIDHSAMKLSVRGIDVVTTTLEFRLIDYLAKHRGHAFTRDLLLDAVWGESQFVTPRSVDACIRRLREKIEPDITSPTYLKTVRGTGYRFDAVAVWPYSGEDCNCVACAPSGVRATQARSLMIRRTAAS